MVTKNNYFGQTNLQFSQGETTTLADLGIVFNSLSTDSRVQEAINRARRDAGSLLDSVLSASQLATRLIKPGLDAELPVLAEVLVRELIVVLQDHCRLKLENGDEEIDWVRYLTSKN